MRSCDQVSGSALTSLTLTSFSPAESKVEDDALGRARARGAAAFRMSLATVGIEGSPSTGAPS